MFVFFFFLHGYFTYSIQHGDNILYFTIYSGHVCDEYLTFLYGNKTEKYYDDEKHWNTLKEYVKKSKNTFEFQWQQIICPLLSE